MSAPFTPRYATLASGRNVCFCLLHHGLYDLFDFGYLHLNEYSIARMWLHSYEQGGALPGSQKFYDPFSNEHVYFLQFLDGIFELMVAARNNESIDTSETDDEDPEDENERDIWMTFPINIGRFGLGPTFRWAH